MMDADFDGAAEHEVPPQFTLPSLDLGIPEIALRLIVLEARTATVEAENTWLTTQALLRQAPTPTAQLRPLLTALLITLALWLMLRLSMQKTA
jgi:hypothetical protein